VLLVRLGRRRAAGAYLAAFGIAVLLGWRGSYYLNRIYDRISGGENPPVSPRQCHVCGIPYEKDFMQRQSHYYCSYRCWFDRLKDQRRSARPLVDKNGHFTRQEIYPMTIKEVNPTQAKELLDGNDSYTYIDVRSMQEYEAGHPAGSLNIPIMHKEAMGLVANLDFVPVVEKHFEHGAKLLLGCQMGGRSLRAAEALVAAGFTDVSNVMGGFGGARDQMGQSVEKGWAELGLPVEQGLREGSDYPSLAKR
jgi:rhodanese-related sulfurtransferase